MSICKFLLLDYSEIIYCSKCKVFFLGTLENCRTFCRIKELTFLIEKLEGVPLLWIMRSSKDDTSISLLKNNGHLCSRSRSKTCLDYINTA